jgi:hypothetical protein
METKTAPAFAVIGTNPAVVDSPRTPKDVALTIYNALKDGAMPQDFALEMAPYWLLAHPKLTYDDYVNASALAQIAQNLTVSAATSALNDQGNTPSTNVGFGLRTHGFVADGATQGVVAKAESALGRAQAIANVSAALQQIGCGSPPAADDSAACPALRNQLAQLGAALPRVEDALASAAANLRSVLAARTGLSIGLAGALAFRTPTQAFTLAHFSRAATWLTVGYRASSGDLAAVVRYVAVDAGAGQSARFVDAGLRLGLVWPQFGVSVEGVYRSVSAHGVDVPNSWRITGMLKYVLSDNVYVSATFGKDLADETNKGAVISLLGLSFQAAQSRMLQPKSGDRPQ